MKSHARVAIIGGGIGGLSALYHLTQEGWNDIVLLERNELTSGTTWHSAAQCPSLAFNQLLLLLRDYTIKLYKELADDPAYPINYHHSTGGMRLLTNQIHVDEAHHIMSVAKGLGLEFDLLDAAEAKRRNPLLNINGVLAALWDEKDGDIDPAQLCQALAARSRRGGAIIHRNMPVTGLAQKPNGEWLVTTDNGTITTEHIVVAAGYRVNEVGVLMGIKYPVIAMGHMYFITEDIPDLTARDDRIPMVRCPRATFYMRQEKKGLLVGVYEHDCKTFGMDGIDPDFVSALCPDDLDRLLPRMESIFARLPCLQEVGIKAVVNGPISYAADAGPLVGKQPGVHNCWSMNGLRVGVGIGEGGDYGKMLAQMMVHGETEWDTWQLDPRRITSFANTEYTTLKSIEDYRHEFRWRLPDEHRPAERPAKASPLYPVLKERGAEFGLVNGWERTTFYKPDAEFVESHTNTHTLLVIAGPKTRNLLAAVSPRTKWGQPDFPLLTAQPCFIGHVEALAIAISYSGEQAFELHVPNSQLYAAYEILRKAGEAFGLTHFGMYAIDSMRMEKGYGHWKGDFITEFNPIEAGLDRFVDMHKEFPGKAGLKARISAGKRKQRVLLKLDNTHAPAQPDEGVFLDRKPVGSITSAVWGYRTQKNLAMAYVDPAHATEGTFLEVLLIGQSTRALSVNPACSIPKIHSPGV